MLIPILFVSMSLFISCTKKEGSAPVVDPVAQTEATAPEAATAVANCDTYRFSTCPDTCEKVCITSAGTPAKAGATDDCDGVGSCKAHTN